MDTSRQTGTERAPALLLRLGANLYALPLESVAEVLPALPIDVVPRCPAYVRGVVRVRGQLIPVISAAERLAIKDYERPPEPHLVCLRWADRPVAVEFDEALDVVDLRSGEPLAADALGARHDFFSGVVDFGGQVVRQLDPRRLVALDETARFEEMMS